jgi:hypothetical protein
MKILLKVPSRERHAKLLPLLAHYRACADHPDDLFILLSLDEDDPTLTEESLAAYRAIPNCTVVVGRSSSKIHACNRDMDRAPPFDCLILASDDMVPEVQGYDRILASIMTKHFPTTDGVIWTNDGYRGKTLNTLCILGRAYYERFGYIYHPDYKSLYCDNEFTVVSVCLQKVVYTDTVLIRHCHPYNLETEQDELYTRNNRWSVHDKLVYLRRLHAGFPKNGLLELQSTPSPNHHVT